MCISCICLFIFHALISVLFLFLLVPGAAVCDCDTPWIFLNTAILPGESCCVTFRADMSEEF